MGYFPNQSSGASSLITLSDVTITSPADNDLLAYDSGTSKYANQTAAQAGVATASHTHSSITAGGTGSVEVIDGIVIVTAPDTMAVIGDVSLDGALGSTGWGIQADGNANFGTGIITARGNAMTELNADNIAFGTLSAARIPTLVQSKITNLVSDLAAKAPLASPTFTGTVTGGTFSGVGSALTTLNASNLSSGTVANARTTGTTTNTASTLVLRDSNGDFAGRNITIAGQTVSTVQALSDVSSVPWDVNAGPIATLTIGGPRTLAAPSNIKAGGTYILTVTQDGTGSRTLAYNAVFKWAGGVTPVLSTAAGSKDVLTFFSPDGTNLYGSLQKGFA